MNEATVASDFRFFFPDGECLVALDEVVAVVAWDMVASAFVFSLS
jgi:hypothetical protein